MTSHPSHLSDLSRRHFLKLGAVGALAATGPAALIRGAESSAEYSAAEWRNRQSSMTYRRLGRTGMMISEVVSGGDPIRLDNYEHLRLAIEMGLNYLDMAPAYGGGECERAYGKIVAQPSMREKVFLNTKISGFTGVRNRLYREIFDGLSPGKQEAIRQRAEAMQNERAVKKPGYFLEYFPGQQRQFGPTYLSIAMQQDYAHRVEGSRQFREFMTRSLEESLQRVGTDHFDLVMCPHGACAPEEVQIPEIHATFEKLKQAGKVRFLGVSAHNDPAGVLHAAVDSGNYDAAMVAYNVINGGYVEGALRKAAQKDVGVIGMKVAMAVATHHRSLQPIPDWRIQKVERIVPGDMKPPMKAYLWALQNPHLCGVISNLWDPAFIRENLSIAGKKVDLQSA